MGKGREGKYLCPNLLMYKYVHFIPVNIGLYDQKNNLRNTLIAEQLCDSILHFLVILIKLGMLLCYMNEMNIGYGATQNF